MKTTQEDCMTCRLSPVESKIIIILINKSLLMFQYFQENRRILMLRLKQLVIMFKTNKFIKINQIKLKEKIKVKRKANKYRLRARMKITFKIIIFLNKLNNLLDRTASNQYSTLSNYQLILKKIKLNFRIIHSNQKNK